MKPVQHEARGAALAVAASAAFVVNDTLMKLGAADLPAMQVLALRGIFASLALGILLAVSGQWRDLSGFRDKWMWGRAVTEFGAVGLFILALLQAPIADVSTILSLNPVLLVCAAAFLLGERISMVRWALVAVAFLGALCVAQPGSTMNSAMGFAVGAVLLSVVRDLCAKRASPTVPPLIGSLLTVLVVLCGSALFSLAGHWKVPETPSLWLLAGSGILIALAHIALIRAFQLARVSVVAPLLYTNAIFALISSVLVFRDPVNALAVLGILLIVGSGVALTGLRSA